MTAHDPGISDRVSLYNRAYARGLSCRERVFFAMPADICDELVSLNQVFIAVSKADLVRCEHDDIIKRDVVLSLAFQYIVDYADVCVVLPQRIVEFQLLVVVYLQPVVLVGVQYSSIVALDFNYIYTAAKYDDMVNFGLLVIV